MGCWAHSCITIAGFSTASSNEVVGVLIVDVVIAIIYIRQQLIVVFKFSLF